ncbi:MAG TPA: DUF1810 domain-containing protein [Spirochaetia bacterium]|nr:DUF1810 domain-containing protein [Spirochaetia bacterium]
MDDGYNLRRFLDAQESVIDTVIAELAAGRKRSHWMWFVFPQIRGLGHSPTAQYYGIGSLAEARAYLDHPVLGERLRSFTKIVLDSNGPNAETIFGYPDYLKFRSSITLFELAEMRDGIELQNCIFSRALERYYRSVRDPETLRLIGEGA